MAAGSYDDREAIGGNRVRLAGYEWSALVSEARLGAARYRVVHPARPFAHASLHTTPFTLRLSVNQAATAGIAAAWWLAARSPHSLVYLPLRSSTDCGAEDGSRKLDLVLLHHRLGFSVSAWKSVRAKLTRPKAHTVALPPDPFPPIEAADHERRHHAEFRDHLRWTVAAETLFIVGSRRAFEYEGEQMRELAEDFPAQVAMHPDWHFCAEVDLGRARTVVPDGRNPYTTLHIERCNEHW